MRMDAVDSPDSAGRAGRADSAAIAPTSRAYRPLHLDAADFATLLAKQGPSLALWRAAEIAALREHDYARPILDLGCGDGIVASMVFTQVDLGVDPNLEGIARAARLGIYERFEARPAQRMRVADSSIGTAVSNSVLEHISEIDAVLAEVARVLRPGGRLIFTTPSDTFGRWLALPSAHYAEWRNRQLCHLNLWTVEQWITHLAAAGLIVDAVRPYLRRRLVWAWDALDLAQQVWIGRHRLFSLGWKRLPQPALRWMAEQVATLDLAAPNDGGGRLIVARKP